MTNEMYEEIQNAFADIRFDPLGSIRAEMTLKTAKRELKKEKETEDSKLLIYCIDTMFDILNEGNREKIYDFADVVHNIPEICMGQRNFYSFREEIKVFRIKYGEKYFSAFNKINPRFSKKAPKNSWMYFLPGSDDDFKKQHPVAYGFLCALGLIALFAPVIAYLIVCYMNHHVFDNGFVMLGFAGSFMIGIGLFNIVAAFVHQYLGHIMTLICIGGGGTLVAVTLALLLTPETAAKIDADISMMYVIHLVFLPIIAGYYMMFRFSMSNWFKTKKIKRSEINRLAKGKKNYWWYEALHQEYGLGAVYYLNKSFTVLYAVTAFMMMALGWIREIIILNAVLYTLVCILGGVMSMFTSVQDNLEAYGKPVVLYKSNGSGFKYADSIFYDLFKVGLILFFAYMECKLVWEHFM